ncbi:MAG TPA: M20/M25/M40 family metallo-hydrolase [Gemmatimonadota bacterium]|nr:M20/M25/M40 family metallo-hydrolase [Gemmatimonadota bacterium]
MPRSRPPAGSLLLLALLAGAGAIPASAQVGFTTEGAERQRRVEASALRSIAPGVLEELARPLSASPHVAGSPGQAAFRDTLLARLAGWGFAPRVETYRVYLPWAVDVRLSLVAPERIDFELVETVPGAPDAPHPMYPWANGYSGVGDVEAEAVYVNYGLHEDYDRLAAIGLDVRGKVAVARYGRSYRGIKARLAEDHGAAALVLYSDPRDDGWFRGDPYPEGLWRPRGGIQRGSVKIGAGDPTTPGGPSVEGAPRVAPADSPHGVPAIPVVPVSADVATEILSRLGGARLPESDWQGGLPFRYHLGPGPATVRLVVEDDRDGPEGGFKDVSNVLATVAGAEWPDEWVIVGGHIDAWGPGANDNVSGTVSVLAAARAVRELVDAGLAPRRSIVFAGWDGEEWGLIGSTEWAEEHAVALAADAVAYLNQDMITGPAFGAGATPSLKPLIRSAAAAIPSGDRTLAEVWADADSARAIGDLGGGSDFEGFYHHLGIPSASHGFGGPYGLYHSAFDTWDAAAIADPGFANRTLSSELVAILALRLANAEVLPFDYENLASEVGDQWRARRGEVVAAGSEAADAAGRLDEALDTLAQAATGFAAARDRYLAGPPDPDRSGAANAALRAVERELTRAEGLVGRPWNRNLVFSTDERNGYATLALPSMATALRSGDPGRIARETDDLAVRFRAAARRVASASASLGP